jgi:hypothetical protein
VSADPDQDVAEVVDGIDAIGLAGGDERVEPGDVVAGIFMTDEEEVFSSECKS